MDMVIDLDVDPGLFYDLAGGFFLPTRELRKRSTISIDKPQPLACMFSIYFAFHAGERVGFFFTTRFEVMNGGGYLLTTFNRHRKATHADVLIKSNDLVLYNYPNRGTIAISPKVSPEIETIFNEQ